MTIGIYCLSFGDSDKVYIGQSIDIERRYNKHINRLSKETTTEHRNYKLLEAYTLYGKPTITILEVCTTSLLDTKEIFWISEFDSIKNGLNICAGGKSGWGVSNGSSVYTEEQILEVFNMLSDPVMYTQDQIYTTTNLPLSLIRCISHSYTHTWLEEAYPEKYEVMVQLNPARAKKADDIGHAKLVAKNIGINYPTIIDSEGIEYIVDSVRGFAVAHSIDASNLIKMLDGKYKVCGKFRLKDATDKIHRTKKIYGSLISPDGEVFKDISNIRNFADTRGLDPSSIAKVLRGTKPAYKGWTLA